jgi:hypothetical protein
LTRDSEVTDVRPVLPCAILMAAIGWAAPPPAVTIVMDFEGAHSVGDRHININALNPSQLSQGASLTQTVA